MSAIGDLIAAAAAIAAFITAYASRRAASETRRSAQAQLVLMLVTAYSAPEMLEAIILAQTWDGTSPILAAPPLDHSRRFISHHFQRIAKLHKAGFLDDDAVRAVLTKEEVALFCQVIQPMDAKVNPGYDHWSFDYLADLLGGRAYLPHLPARADGSGGTT